MKKRLIILAASLTVLFGLPFVAMGQVTLLNLLAGESVEINCAGTKLNLTRQSATKVVASCKGSNSTPVPSSPTPVPPTPTPTFTPPPPPPGGYSETFPQVNSLALGMCSAEVHDQYAVIGPDGKKYRTWHPIADPSGCTFAHEHGDAPHPGAPQPAFGHVAAVHGHFAEIAAHQGFKCFTHYANGNNGWGRPELDYGGLPIDFSVCVHQGTGGAARLSERFHSFWFWSTYEGKETLVTVMVDTGSAVALCGSNEQNGEAEPGRFIVAHDCNIYEQWIFKANIGGVWTSNVSDFAVTNPVTHVDGGTLTGSVKPTTCDPFTTCTEHGTLGTGPSLFYLGNMRTVHEPDWQWRNVGGQENFCTDAMGNLAECGPNTIQQKVATVNLDNSSARLLDRTANSEGFKENQDILWTVGVPGGN